MMLVPVFIPAVVTCFKTVILCEKNRFSRIGAILVLLFLVVRRERRERERILLGIFNITIP